jgi:RimJ/RimL family protein N-acetyltransferase
MKSPEILTQRLRLSKLTAADAPAMFRYRSDPEVCRFQGFEPAHQAEVANFIHQLEFTAWDAPGTWFQFGLRLRNADDYRGELVGDLGVHFLADDPRQVEIGFSLDPAWQGQGLATEAVTALIDHLFRQAGKHRVIASVDPRNTPSVALLRRVGMQQEAHFRSSLWFKGAWVDDLVFAVLREEWQS